MAAAAAAVAAVAAPREAAAATAVTVAVDRPDAAHQPVWARKYGVLNLRDEWDHPPTGVARQVWGLICETTSYRISRNYVLHGTCPAAAQLRDTG